MTRAALLMEDAKIQPTRSDPEVCAVLPTSTVVALQTIDHCPRPSWDTWQQLL
jgi:hypothetical protein